MYQTGATAVMTEKQVQSTLSYYCNQAKTKEQSMVFFKILLSATSSLNYIPQTDLTNIGMYFDYIRSCGLKVVVRAAYDFDGNTGMEPENISTIYSHIADLCTVYNAKKDVITVVETGLIGPWGEMHSCDKYLTDEALQGIVYKYLECLDPSLMVNVRRPSYYRRVLETNNPVTSYLTAQTYAGRVGMYNDGYLASESDYGTYTDWTREQELTFQQQHNLYTIFGGEAVLGTGYGTDADFAIADMRRTHPTYFNDGWDPNLLNYWKADTYEGQNAFEYIANHLGYRFVLTQSYVAQSAQAGKAMPISITINNTGFASIVRNHEVEVLFKNGDNVYTAKTDVDARAWLGGQSVTESFEVTVPAECTDGTWQLYLKLPDRTGDDNCAIKFANTTGWNDELYANYFGTVEVVTEQLKDAYVFEVGNYKAYSVLYDFLYDIAAPCAYDGGFTYVPFRDVAQVTGARSVEYDAETGAITLVNKDGWTFNLTMGETVASYEYQGYSGTMQTLAPKYIGGWCCLPLRDAANFTFSSIEFVAKDEKGYIVISNEALSEQEKSDCINAYLNK